MIPLWGWVSLGSSSSRIIWSTWFSPIAVTRANCDKLGFFPSSFILWIFYNYTPLITIVRKKTTNIFNICVYIYTQYTLHLTKNCSNFVGYICFFPKKHILGWFFFPVSLAEFQPTKTNVRDLQRGRRQHGTVQIVWSWSSSVFGRFFPTAGS